MKSKILLAFTALALLACTQEEVVDTPQAAITFSNAFIENSTHMTKVTDPSVTKTSLEGFAVWGYRNETANVVFEGEIVTPVAGSDKWTYSSTQYWIPYSKYYFAALAPINNKNWSLDLTGANTYPGTVTFANAEGTEDLLYSAVAVETPNLNTLLASGMSPVELTFDHLLSKLKFTFVNGLDEDYISLVVKNINMKVPADATINLAIENWWDNAKWTLVGTKKTILDFGATAEIAQGVQASSQNQRLTIPAAESQEYEIEFTVEVKMDGKVVMEIPKTATLKGKAFQMGKSYNIKSTLKVENLGLKPIEFEVVGVEGWIEGEDATF
jgi:hypothetical protein